MRSYILSIIITFLVVSCVADETERDSQSYTIGIVNPVAMRDAVVESFIDSLANLGYTEGDNVTYLYEGAIADSAGRAEWVAELVAAEVDLIVGIATPGAISAAEGTDTIPVLFFPVTDPVGSNLVVSLQSPGGNVTGITNGNPHPLRLQILLEIDPSIEVVYAPYDADSPPAISTVPSILDIADELGVEVNLTQVQTEAEINAAVQNIPANTDAIFNLPDPRVADRWQEWSQAAIRRGIPYSSLSYTEAAGGALMSYGEELNAVGRQAARMADAILQGASPADIPVETADFFLSINLDTADAIDLTIPETILQRADFLIRDDDGDDS